MIQFEEGEKAVVFHGGDDDGMWDHTMFTVQRVDDETVVLESHNGGKMFECMKKEDVRSEYVHVRQEPNSLYTDRLMEVTVTPIEAKRELK